jgi:hypothetical protein
MAMMAWAAKFESNSTGQGAAQLLGQFAHASMNGHNAAVLMHAKNLRSIVGPRDIAAARLGRLLHGVCIDGLTR